MLVTVDNNAVLLTMLEILFLLIIYSKQLYIYIVPYSQNRVCNEWKVSKMTKTQMQHQ